MIWNIFSLLLNAHWAAHRHKKNENCEHEIYYKSFESSFQFWANCSKNSLNQKWKLVLSTQVSSWLSILHFICNRFCCNFGCDLFRIIPEIVEKNLESEQTPFFLDRLSILMKFDLMFCTGLDLQNVFYSYAFFFTQRPIINDRKIEQSNECCYVQWQVLAKSIELHKKNGPKFTSRLQAPKFTYH